MYRNYEYGTRSNTKINSCHQYMINLCTLALNIANSRKLHCPDFGIVAGKRTQEEQLELFKYGRNLVDGEWIVVDQRQVVTNCDGYGKLSKHQSGYAIDFVPLDKKGRADYSELACMQVATCFFEAASELGLDIDWGGSWRSISDLPHIEII